MDIDIISQAKDVYFDSMIRVLNNLQIPDFYQDKNHYMTGNSFQINERTEDVTIYTDVNKNAVVFKCSKLSGKFINTAYRYRKDLITADGHLEVDLNTILVQFGFSFDQTYDA